MSTNKKPVCSICKSALIPKDFNRYILDCHQCHHTFFTSVWDSNNNNNLEDSDIELESSIESNDGPSLIASSHGMNDFTLMSSSSENDANARYENNLRKIFGSYVTISTEISF